MATRQPPTTWQLAQVHLQVQLLRLAAWVGTLGKPASHAFPPTRELSIPSSDGRRRIKLLIFDPPNSTPGPQPVYINFHGSGFIQPSLGVDGRLLTCIAREAGCIVVDGDYRKAPEHPFPAPYEDAFRVVAWVLENTDGQFDVSRVAVGGVSAGANLALAVVVNMPPNTIKGVSVIVPAIDFTVPYAQRRAPPDMPEAHKKEPDRGGPIPPALGELMQAAYLGRWTNTKDPRLSPNCGDMTRFPGGQTVFIASAEYDYLDEEAKSLKDQLVEAGKDPVYMHVEGMGHGYVTTNESDTAAAARRDETFAKVVETLRRAFDLAV
ncbi:alpha/beta-hydrolase [Calocera cornea HHB12733]|uniref:Alpha/beta-hydrolase n=1 Tax=Calocera cornea HHB12733 TaxID=1353952 RepID=A0A165D9U8_9BASI|nr:alpha/beta-hydrolase [Calocera cornea HHB12733]